MNTHILLVSRAANLLISVVWHINSICCLHREPLNFSQ